MKNFIFLILALGLVFFGCATKNMHTTDSLTNESMPDETKNANGEFKDKASIEETLDYFDHEKEIKEGFLVQDSDKPSFDIPIVINKKVKFWLKYFQGRGRKVMRSWMMRSGKYIPMMKKILNENGLPEDLIYLAMIESGFKPYAYSKARASGPWQFIRGTGQRYGLKANWIIDERRDPEKSTIAAAQHLKDLHDEFNHWYLAAAGYNAGAGKIKRAIKRYSTEDFWEMSKHRYLRRETKNYVPKMIAAALIAKNPKEYGFENIKYEAPIAYDKVIVSKPTDLNSIASKIGIPFKELKLLNPELLRWFTPPNYPNYELKVPRGKRDLFLAHKNSFKDVLISGVIKHRLRRGQTLSHIANTYRTSVRALMSFNGIRNPRRLRAGKTIRIPIKRGYTPPANFNYAKQTPKTHRLRSGETLSHISDAYGVSVSELLAYNSIRNPKRLKAGQTVKIPAKGMLPKSKSSVKHRLKRGETLSHLADFYGTSIRSLLAYNNIYNPRRLKAGQLINIPPTSKNASAFNARVSRIETAGYEKKAKTGNAIEYVVKSGDTIWSISRAFNVTVVEIRRWNKLGSIRMIHPGDKIKVLPRFINESDSQSRLVNTKTDTNKTAKFHRVQRGDTLWDISNTYKIPLNNLISLNKLNRKSKSIKPGDILKLAN